MLKVFRVNDDEYICVSKDGAHYGGLIKTVDHMARIGIDDASIEDGLVSLQLNDHHVAEYGLFRTFMFSKRIVL
jgi:hypothetical protein